MFRFIAADLRRHAAGVLAIVLIVALASALGVAVTLGERALRLGSARAGDAVTLLVGAAGSETQLVLSAVFLQPAPLPLLPGAVLAKLAADPRVAFAAPVGFGDYAGETPIVGTTPALPQSLAALTEGRLFARLGEAVAGSEAGLAVGADVTPLHGARHLGGAAHGGAAYRVVGRLAPTGTPFDRALFVPIEAVWTVHGSQGGAHDEHDADDAHEAEENARHRHGAFDADAPLDPSAVLRADAPGVPAILVEPRTIADAYRLRTEYRDGSTLAVFPAEVLTRLYATLGDARAVLQLVAAGAQGLVAAAILLVVAVHVAQRRRQIGALRAFGASRLAVVAVVWSEVFAIVALGILLGFGLGVLAVRIGAGTLAPAAGFPLPVELGAGDVFSLGVLLALAAVVAALPAMSAYRQSPAEALRG